MRSLESDMGTQRVRMRRTARYPNFPILPLLSCTSRRGHDSIAVFAIDRETGLLTFVAHEPAQALWPSDLETDPAGRSMLAVNYESDSAAVWRIGSETGRLTPPRNGGAEAPKPTRVVMLPVGG